MSNSEQQTCLHFTLDEIKKATRNFDEELVIGKGGFGMVYRGFINNDSEVVAIKRLSIASTQGETEFLREIETLSKLKHPHLVCLKGFCNESEEMILVYEYMPNGTLADHLYKITDGDDQQFGLTWEERLSICIGAARGLDYLHREYVPGIIHRDIKDSNILLDENFVAKIADFGLAKLVKTSNESHTTIVSSTGVKGTFGYLDPEYFYTQRLSKKTDVYAFGVLLLVVLCGRPAVDNKATEDQRSLAEWANKCIQKNRVVEIIDPHLAGKISPMSLKQFVKVSQKCVRRQSEQRPTMEEVVSGLELALKKQPALYGTTSSQSNGRTSLTQMVAKLQIVLTKKQSGNEKLVPSSLVTKNLCPKISLDEIKTATQNFNEKLIIGEGGFGIVYRGRLNDGSEVAIKKIKKETYAGESADTKFWWEIETLCKLQHDHVVPLKGYCKMSSEMCLVYEYMLKGSLQDHLVKHGDNQQAPLTWEERLNICIGSARGINFLHKGEPPIIHRNVKCSNILLDDKFVPKISSLKLSMIDDGDNSTRVVGTMGYVDPEYVSNGRVTTKSDVYGFGVVLLVVLSGTKPLVFDQYGERTWILEWAIKCMKENTIGQIIDPHLRGQIKSESLEQFLKISLQCVREQSKDRPTMEEVVSGLELAMEFQLNNLDEAENSQAHSDEENSQAHSDEENSQAHSDEENSQAHSDEENSQAHSDEENSQAHSDESGYTSDYYEVSMERRFEMAVAFA